MKRIYAISIILCLCFVSAVSGAEQPRKLALLPQPQRCALNDRLFKAKQVSLQADPATTAMAVAFCEALSLPIAEGSAHQISITLTDSIEGAALNQEEAYRIQITDRVVAIQATTEKGAYWAFKTLRQLSMREADVWSLPQGEITDWPAFRFRGLMQDVGRSYISMEELKREIDALSNYKMNVFHWHLTENQAWRLESKRFPQLNDSCHMSRMPGQYYTMAEAKELMAYCQQRQVLLIPEIDMPGHSAAFVQAMGHDMQSEEGMAILKQLLDEICELFAELPYLHIGTDEVQFTNPRFVPEMVAYIRAKGKKVISWNPGWTYQPGEIDMTQLWSYRGKAQPGIPAIDCRFHYINHFDTFADLIGLYTSRIYDQPQGSPDLAGAILAVWHDRLTLPETDLIRTNNLYPNLLALAERTWLGGGFQYFDQFGTCLPLDPTDPAHQAFVDFERRMLYRKAHDLPDYPFAYVRQTDVRWRITDAFPNEGDLARVFPPETALQPSYTYQGKTYGSREAIGAGIYLRHVWGTTVPGFFAEPQENHTAYAWTWIYSPQAQEVGAWIEFQNYSRSEKDLPPRQGEWDYKGSHIWVNDELIAPPRWTATHTELSNEIPLGNENCVVRKPTPIQLRKGWNKVLLKLPVGAFRTPEVRLVKWMFTFACVTPDGERAVDGLIYSPDKILPDSVNPYSKIVEPMTAWTKLADLPGVDQREALGVSAPFAGTHNGSLIVAGGCNFPDKPVAEGGTKRYYDEVFLLGSEGWKMIGHLPTPVAYGAAVSTPEGVICIGGNNAERGLKEVIRLSVSAQGDALEIDTLPSLPVTMDNMAAAYADGQLFVVGGNAYGVPCRSLYRLDLTQNTLAWEALPDFPGACRVQPVLVAKGNGETQQLYLAGGFQPIEGDQDALLPTELLTFDTATRTWRTESELPPLAEGGPRTLTGGNALLWDAHRILYFGGVNYQKFADAVNRPLRLKAAEAAADTATLDSLRAEAAQYLRHPVEWYRFNTDLLVYDTETKQWERLGSHEPLARAGAGAVITDQQVTVICGELKPGIRTPQVNQLDLSAVVAAPFRRCWQNILPQLEK